MDKIDRIYDGLLVLRFRGGENGAIDLLVKRHHPRLCTHAFWYAGDMDLAKDIVQDCWIKAMGNINKLEDPDKFGSWMMTIVTRKSLDVLRRRKRERGAKEEIFNSGKSDDKGSDEDQSFDLLSKLKTGIGELSGDHQIVLRLFYVQEYSLNEISGILDISPGTVKSRLFHAREKLKTLIK